MQTVDPLSGSHIMPKSSDRTSMSCKLKVKSLLCSDLGKLFDKSFSGFEQSLLDSSNLPVSWHLSPNQTCLSVWCIPSFAKVWFHCFLHLLYSSKKFHLILMNR